MGIYQAMKDNWETYCLMAGISIIEEFSKPRLNIKIVSTKKGMKKYYSYSSIRLKMKDKDLVNWWLDTTRYWEIKLGEKFIETKQLHPFTDGDQFCIYFNTNWAYQIIKTIGKMPSKSTNKSYLLKLKYWKANHYGKTKLNSIELNRLRNFSLYPQLKKDIFLAAGAFIVSFDLEFRGVQTGRLNLTMSEKYKDFLLFMLKLAKYHGWATNNILAPISVEYSRKLGIKATNQFGFSISSKKLYEIYNLAGPLYNREKDKCINFHANRSRNYINKGFYNRNNLTKNKLLNLVLEKSPITTTKLQFYVNVGNDVINYHLRQLNHEGKISKFRQGKRNIWSGQKCQ